MNVDVISASADSAYSRLEDDARVLWGVYTIQQTSSNSRVFWIHLLEVCWIV